MEHFDDAEPSLVGIELPEFSGREFFLEFLWIEFLRFRCALAHFLDLRGTRFRSTSSMHQAYCGD